LKEYRCEDCNWRAGTKWARSMASRHRRDTGHTVNLVDLSSGEVVEEKKPEERRPERKATPLSILKQNELIPPELALREIGWDDTLPVDGKFREGMKVGMGTVLLGVRIAQVLSGMQADSFRGQLEIFREAKGESETAELTALRMADEVKDKIIQELTPKIEKLALSSTPNPMLTMFTSTMEPIFKQVVTNLLKAFFPTAEAPQSSAPPGFVRKKLEE